MRSTAFENDSDSPVGPPSYAETSPDGQTRQVGAQAALTTTVIVALVLPDSALTT